MSAEQDSIRIERDRLLRASDWSQLPDAPLTEDQKIAWAAYRHALRELPEQYTAANVVWPVAP